MSVTLRGGGGVGPVGHFVTRGRGRGQNWPKKRYVIVERPLAHSVIVLVKVTNSCFIVTHF